MKKTFKLNGFPITIVAEIGIPQPFVKGLPVPPKQVVDKEGSWIQVEFLAGQQKGCRVPTTKESLTEIKG